MSEQTALITGASSGIGLELTRLFAADKYNLILVARSEDKLQQLSHELTERHNIQVGVWPYDLADSETPYKIFERLKKESIRISVLVNNAGFGLQGSVAELETDQQIDMIQVNVAALTALTRLLLPEILQHEKGGILNVASTAGFQPGPFMTVYYATKAYVVSFTEGLAEEVKGRITISCLAPGPTETEFVTRAGMEESTLFKFGAMSAKQVAEAGYRGFQKGRLIVIPGIKNKIGVWALRLTPRSVVRKVTKLLNT